MQLSWAAAVFGEGGHQAKSRLGMLTLPTTTTTPLPALCICAHSFSQATSEPNPSVTHNDDTDHTKRGAQFWIE